MSSVDLDLKNYNYYELLNLFQISPNDNKNKVLYKINKKMKDVEDTNCQDNILFFFKKCKLVALTIYNLIDNQIIQKDNVEPFMTQMYNIDDENGIEKYSDIDLYNKIINIQIENGPKMNLNSPYYNLNKLDYDLNNKNNTNEVYNIAVNEASPGELNSVKRVTQLLNLNINSCFRHNYFQSSPCDFLYNLPLEIKNVLSMRLVSIEIPNSWYLFSSLKQNNIFYIFIHDNHETCEYKIEIKDGNYNYETLEQYLNTTYFCDSGLENDLTNIKFSINPQNLKSQFEIIDNEECSNFNFSIKFCKDTNQNMINTAGWILGYRIANYLNVDKVVSEGLFDAGGDRYVFLSINDYQYNNNISNIVCFDKSILNEDVIAKVPMNNGKLSLIINDNNNNLAKIRRYNGPINLSKLQIKLLDQFGSVINLNNMDFSLTIEMQILYENFNFKNVTA